MIDWLGVSASMLWIGGCALALTTLNIALWHASISAQALRAELARPNRRTMFYGAGALFCAGWAITPDWSWEQLVWIAFAMLFALKAWRASRAGLAGIRPAR